MMKQLFVIAALCALSVACGSDSAPVNPYDSLPSFISDAASVTVTTYDGVNDDLLTGGNVNADGTITEPAATDNFTTAEVRSKNIASNYNAFVDPLSPDGMGVWWGPTSTEQLGDASDPVPATGQVAGTEYKALTNTKGINVLLSVQIPDSFDVDNPCIVAAPPSGTRGLYGAIASAGDYGLRHGCAVAYNSKGTGEGIHIVGLGKTLAVDNTVVADDSADAMFVAEVDAGYANLSATTVASSHAHSQQNVEKDWGYYTLQSVEFALYALNRQFPIENFIPNNTTVVAASWSNGGRAAIMPAEEDTKGLIDGVVAVEPNTAMGEVDFSIAQGSQSWGPESVGWSLYDYFALGGIYMPCATGTNNNNRCEELQSLGLLTSADPSAAAQKLIDNGFLMESIELITNLENFYPRITANYSNSYGRYRLSDDLCQVTFAYNGGPADADIINQYVGENIVLDPVNLRAGEDNMFGLSKDLCFYALSIYGKSELEAAGLFDTYKHDDEAYDRVQGGLSETVMSGDLQGIPTILIQGRSDQVVAPNHGARAYYARNRQVENRDDVVYWEVENGHHLEMFQFYYNLGAFGPGPNPDITYLNPYFHEAMDQMFTHLADGTPFAPSQVIRTTPGPIGEDMFGPIQDAPGAADAITWADNTLTIPE